MRTTKFAIATIAGLAACFVAACQTTKSYNIPRETESGWQTIPEEKSLVHFTGKPRPGIIFTEARDDGDDKRQERAFLLTDTYGFFRSRVLVTLIPSPADPADTGWLHDSEHLTAWAKGSRCLNAELSSVAKGSNANGSFIYLTCRRKNRDHCVMATQEIADVPFGADRNPYVALVEWFLCTSGDRKAENLAKFGNLRIQK